MSKTSGFFVFIGSWLLAYSLWQATGIIPCGANEEWLFQKLRRFTSIKGIFPNWDFLLKIGYY